MSFNIPAVGFQSGSAIGGGLLDSFKTAMQQATGAQQAGATQQSTTQLPTSTKGDGSVGLFDGVLKKALLGGAMGLGVGFLPFLPGGPVLGGIVGAIAGAGIGVFQNYRKIKSIQQENAAFLSAIGVQPQTQEEAQLLLSGNVKQLYQQVPVDQIPVDQIPVDPKVDPNPDPKPTPTPTPDPKPTPTPTPTPKPVVQDPSAPPKPNLPPPFPDLTIKNTISEEEFKALLGDSALPSSSAGGGAAVTPDQLAAWTKTEIEDRQKRVQEYWMKASAENSDQAKAELESQVKSPNGEVRQRVRVRGRHAHHAHGHHHHHDVTQVQQGVENLKVKATA